jgi:hypothetical protein
MASIARSGENRRPMRRSTFSIEATEAGLSEMLARSSSGRRRAPRYLAIAAVALVLLLGVARSSVGQTPAVVDAAALEEVCRVNAPDDRTFEDCLLIVRTVLAPTGSLVLPGSTGSPPPQGVGIGVTRSTTTLAVTLVAVEWEAALFPSEDVDVVAVEVAFKSLAPETYVDPSGLTVFDAEGFGHAWGAIHRMGESPPGGYLDAGRRQRGWVGFEVPSGTPSFELEYRDASGERLVWTVERPDPAA